MENMTKLRKRKGVSPVIATVILVAVTITVAVAVAYWMSGIAGQYTQFEKIEIQSAYAVKYEGTGATGTDNAWKIIITLKNSGTSTATLTSIFLNEKIIGESTTGELSTVYADGTLIPSGTAVGGIGETGDVGITLDSGDSVEVTIIDFFFTYSSSGTTINVKLHSAAGMDYIRLLQLP